MVENVKSMQLLNTLAKSSPGKKLHGGKMKLIVKHLQLQN
jgi:hypothetical protein